jgi:hypothetical protein
MKIPLRVSFIAIGFLCCGHLLGAEEVVVYRSVKAVRKRNWYPGPISVKEPLTKG